MQKHLKINSTIDNLRIVETVIDALSSEIKISKENYGKILVSTLEAVNNAIIHGNAKDTLKYVTIDIRYKKGNLIITVSDEGKGFIPENLPDPTKPGNIESINGRGVFLMSKLADEIEFRKRGSCVIMTFKT
jgi:serine/threonine-protein kinase RsbW